MSLYRFGSNSALHASRRSGSRADLSGSSYQPAPGDGFFTLTRQQQLSGLQQRALFLQAKCQDSLHRADFLLQSGDPGRVREAEHLMGVATEMIDQLRAVAMELSQLGQPNNMVIQSMEVCKDQLKAVHVALGGSLVHRSRSSRGSLSWEEPPPRSYQDAVAWIGQQMRLIETSPWPDDPAAIEQQMLKHSSFHSNITRSTEVQRARDELLQRGDKASLHALDQEWDTLQKLWFEHEAQLRELHGVLESISSEIMWVNEHEEEELVFDWSSKNIDKYIPLKQESYSELMRKLELKEKDLNKLKLKVDALLKNGHPASDKIEAYMETLQTQWSWLLQITKCIEVHLKENVAYSQFFKEAGELYSKLQKDQDSLRQRFSCGKTTPLPTLLELLKGLEVEKQQLEQQHQQVQQLTNRSRSIVRLAPREVNDKSPGPVMVQALCDFKQDQKLICRGDEAILKDNTQRSKWCVTGPGGLEMIVPSVCLLVPPPNPLSIDMANKIAQCYELLLSWWNQHYIDMKTLVSWQLCIQEITRINSFTVAMLSQMNPDDYQSIMATLQQHYEEFRQNSMRSEMISSNERRDIESQYTQTHTHYNNLVSQLPSYIQTVPALQAVQTVPALQAVQAVQNVPALQAVQTVPALQAVQTVPALQAVQTVQNVPALQAVQNVPAVHIQRFMAEPQTSEVTTSVRSTLLGDVSALWLKMEGVESQLTQYVHLPAGETNNTHLTHIQSLQHDVDTVKSEFVSLRERATQQLDTLADPDKAEFLRSELTIMDQKLSVLEKLSQSYLNRLSAAAVLVQAELQVEDVVRAFETRLTERETASLEASDVQDYQSALQIMKAELEQKEDLLGVMGEELGKAQHWNCQTDHNLHKCDTDLSQHAERVGRFLERWRRIQDQICTRVKDLDRFLVQLQQYQWSSSALCSWISGCRTQLGDLRVNESDDIGALMEQITKLRALNSEIKEHREAVEHVQGDADTCINTIKDYELQLATYSAGLETLLNVPIKRRVMMQSPAHTVAHEVASLQTSYMELLTSSSLYYTQLGQKLKHLEELKIRRTRSELQEEQLTDVLAELEEARAASLRLQEDVRMRKEEVTRSQELLLSREEAQRNQAMQAQEDLRSQLASCRIQLEHEERKRKQAEALSTTLQEEKLQEAQRSQQLLEEKQEAQVELEKEVHWLRGEMKKETCQRQEALQELSRVKEDHSKKLKEVQVEYESHISASQSSAVLLQQQKQEDESEMQRRHAELQEELQRLQLSLRNEEERAKSLAREVQQQRSSALEDQSRCRQLEVQLGQSGQTVEEYTARLSSLSRSQEQAAADVRRAQEEAQALKEEIEHRSKQWNVSSALLASLEEEVRGLKIRLVQEETRVRHGGQQQVEVQRHLEEKIRALNESLAEIQRLQTLTQELTKERLRLEEEVRRSRIQQEELKEEAHNARGEVSALTLQLQNSQQVSQDLERLLVDISQEREKLKKEVLEVQRHAGEMSSHVQKLETHGRQLQTTREEQECSLQALKEELQSVQRDRLQLEEENQNLGRELASLRGVQHGREVEMQALQLQLKQVEEQHRCRLHNVESELEELRKRGDALQQEVHHRSQQPTRRNIHTQTDDTLTAALDPSSLLFDGIHKSISAQQLHDCGIINKSTFDLLLKGQRSVSEVSTSIKTQLKGSGVIAGVASGPQGRITVCEAQRANLLSRESATRLLEAQAATGYILDPQTDRRLTVDEALSRGLADRPAQDRLLTAEAASKGFKDPGTGKLLSASQAYRKGLIGRDTALRLLQAQEAAGGILDPILSVFLPQDSAMDRDLIDEDLYCALNAQPKCYLDPDSEKDSTYSSLKKRCQSDTQSGLLLLPAPPKPMTVQGLRKEVPISELVSANLLETCDLDQLRQGKLTIQDIEHRLRSHLRGTKCIAGVLDEANSRVLPIYQAMKESLLQSNITLAFLEAQAASGFVVDPVANQFLTVEEACRNGVVGPEFKEKLLTAEQAVTGFKEARGQSLLSLYQAIERGLIDKRHGIQLLEAQVASGGIIDPQQSHRVDMNIAYQRGYFGSDMDTILRDVSESNKGFFDPNTQENVTYQQLQSRCTIDQKTGLVLLPLQDKSKDPSAGKSTQRNTLRKRRVVIVDPDTDREMSVQEAFDRKLIDYEMFIELSEQECEWEEITITNPDGSTRLIVGDRKTGVQHDIQELLLKGVIDQSVVDQYQSGSFTLTQFADKINSKVMSGPSYSCSNIPTKSESKTMTSISSSSSASSQHQDPPSSSSLKQVASVSVTLAPPAETTGDHSPVGAVFDSERMEKVSITEALRRGLVDAITAQRLLEAQACSGGIVNPESGRRISVQEASRLGLVDNDMAVRLKPAQKAYIGFEDAKTKRKMSAAEAVREKWLPYEAGQRFLEFQMMTGGLFDPDLGRRRSLEEAVQLGWLDARAAQKLQYTRHHLKALTCPRSKLKVSYREALDSCLKEEGTGVRMLPASRTSSQGISSPYNSNPGSRPGSRRGSVDLTSSARHSSSYISIS
ncbi:desmoplakin-like [Denticeps clupeoides]|nr:desmoplakin-like [Denticeps clupeoides]